MVAYLILDTQIITIDKPVFKIGRALENDLVIQEASLSRYHAEIRQENGTYQLIDMDSSGGSFLNGRKVSQSQLGSGDSIVLAGTALVFVDNAPQLSERAVKVNKQEKDPLRDSEPTIFQVKPDWRPEK